MNIKKQIDERLAGITFDPGCLDMRKTKKRPLRIAIAAVLCLITVFTVMASALPQVNAMVEEISPEAAHLLKPVRLSGEDVGIAIKVVGAMHDEENSVVYLYMEDLEDRPIKEVFQNYNMDIMGDGSEQFTTAVMYSDPAIPNQIGFIMIAGKGSELDGNKITTRITSTEGKWETTYRIQEVTEVKQKDCDIVIDGVSIQEVTVSPIAVTIVGDRDGLLKESDITVILEDSSVVQCHPYPGCILYMYGDETGVQTLTYAQKYLPNAPLEVDIIKKIQIGEEYVIFTE